jgi:hypothetical protein
MTIYYSKKSRVHEISLDESRENLLKDGIQMPFLQKKKVTHVKFYWINRENSESAGSFNGLSNNRQINRLMEEKFARIFLNTLSN